MTINALTTLFGWMTAINIGLLLFSTLMLTVFKPFVIRIHCQLTGLEADQLEPTYIHYLAFYKILIIVFNLVPYLVLRFS